LICETPEMEVSEAILSPNDKVLAAAVGNGTDIWATDVLDSCMAEHWYSGIPIHFRNSLRTARAHRTRARNR
jgi:hypothetical protein